MQHHRGLSRLSSTLVQALGTRARRRNLHVTTPRAVGGRTRAAKAAPSSSSPRPDFFPSSGQASSSGLRAGPYGLKMVDYRNVEPPVWALPPHPPVKGGGGIIRRAQYLAPALAAVSLLGMVYVYFNQDDNMVEYWEQVEQGNVPLDGEDDGDEFDEDELDDVDEKK